MVEPRAARPTLRFVDEYCDLFRDLFPEVRGFEAFKYLHISMISDLKRKTLPAIAKAVRCLLDGLTRLIDAINQFYCPVIHDLLLHRCLFPSERKRLLFSSA